MSRHLHQVLSKWPDFAEVYYDEDTGTEDLVFVVIRKNSRQLHHEQMSLLQALERSGQTVRVRVGTVDLTLEQFEKGGTYNVLASKTISHSQGLANNRSTLKRLLEMRANLPPDSARLYDLNRQIAVLQTMLETGEAPVEQTKLAESNKNLNTLVEVFAAEYTDERICTTEWTEIYKTMPIELRQILIQRKAKLQPYVKENTPNDKPSEPTTQDQNKVGE
jgi:hypothetical protein